MEIKQLQSTRERMVTVDLDGYRHNINYTADDTGDVRVLTMEDRVYKLVTDGVIGMPFGTLNYNGEDITANSITISDALITVSMGMRQIIDFIERGEEVPPETNAIE